MCNQIITNLIMVVLETETDVKFQFPTNNLS